MKKLLAGICAVFAGITVLCALSSSLMSAAASTANSVAVGKLADAIQTAHLLTAFVAVVALLGGIGTGAAWALTLAAIRRERQRQLGAWDRPLDVSMPYDLPGQFFLAPPQGTKRRRATVSPEDDSAPDGSLGGWLDQM